MTQRANSVYSMVMGGQPKLMVLARHRQHNGAPHPNVVFFDVRVGFHGNAGQGNLAGDLDRFGSPSQ
jgi:hypothetical protein